MSGFTLRGYQREAVDRSVSFLLQPRSENGLTIIPCAGGKSLCIAETAMSLDAPVVVFQPSKELLEQNLAKMAAFGFSANVFSASAGRRDIGRITLATIGSVYKNPEAFSHVKYVIFDEAHLCNARNKEGMIMSFLNGLNDVRVLGFTASPWRLGSDGNGGVMLKFLTRTRPRVFTKVVHVTQCRELFQAGYLCPLEYKFVRTGFDRKKLALNTTGSDYTDDSVQKLFRDLNFPDQIVRCCKRLDELSYGGSLVFCRFIAEARYVAERVPCSAVVTGETPKAEREQILAGFKSGRIQHVCNVGVLTTGFDFPELRNVVLARPTRSLGLWYQMVGRCIRTHPSKPIARVIDLIGLSEEFGRIEDLHIVCGPREKWHLESNGRQLTNVPLNPGAPPNYAAQGAIKRAMERKFAHA